MYRLLLDKIAFDAIHQDEKQLMSGAFRHPQNPELTKIEFASKSIGGGVGHLKLLGTGTGGGGGGGGQQTLYRGAANFV